MKALNVLCVWLMLGCSLLMSSRAALAQGVGASVDETRESATLWVDPVAGSDSNPGTQTQPLKSLATAFAQAVTNNRNSIGTLIWANPGTYRESISLNAASKDTNYPITLQAVTPSTATVSGAQQYTGWAAYTAIPGAFSNTWLYQWGTCAPDTSAGAPTQPDIMLRREMVFINGSPLTEVLSTTGLIAGTFTVDEVGGKIYIFPPAGTNLSTADVEVAVNPSVLSVVGKSNLVIRGITFQYGNACRSGQGTGATPSVVVSGSASNIIFDNDTFQWNNSKGLQINNPAANFTISNSTFNHNGQDGIGLFQTVQGLLTNNTASYNNWRGAQGAVYSWNSGGFHPFQNHSMTVNGMSVFWNQTYGAHWDTDHQNIVVNNMTSVNNVMNGDFYEKNEGPIAITNNTYCGNNQTVHDNSAYGGGLVLRNSEQLSVSNTVLYGNGIAQFNIQGDTGGIPITNFASGANYTLITSGITFSNNTFWDSAPGQAVFSDGYLGGADWTSFLSGNATDGTAGFLSNNNTWYDAANTSAFLIPTPLNNFATDLGGYQGATGQDAASQFALPAADISVCTNVPSDFPDFYTVVGAQNVMNDTNGNATATISLPQVGIVPQSVALTVDTSAIPGVSYTMSPTNLTTGGTATVSFVTALGTVAGTYTLPVTATTGVVVHSSSINLTVPDGNLRITPSSLSFPNSVQSTFSPPEYVTLTNAGSNPLTFTSYTPDAHFQIIGNTCPAAGTTQTLAGGASCVITVEMFYGTAGLFNKKTLTVRDSDPASPQTITLNGRVIGKPTAAFTPTSLNCGTVNIDQYGNGGVPCNLFATFQNTSYSSPLTINTISEGTDTYNNWNFTHDCPVTPSILDTRQTCTVTATYTPSLPGTTQNSTVLVTDNASQTTQTLTLNGTSKVIYPTPKFSPTTLVFGTVTEGTSKTITSTFTNTQTNALGKLTFSVIGSPTGTDAAEYRVTNNCGATLAANASCLFTAVFSPTNLDVTTVTLVITDDATPTTQTLTMTGTGGKVVPTASFTPTKLSFGTITVGTSSTLTATLTNTSISAYANLNLTSPFTFTGATAPDWSQTNNCPSTLAAGASCTFSVTFTPSAKTSRNSTLPITDNVTAGKTTLTVTGSGK